MEAGSSQIFLGRSSLRKIEKVAERKRIKIVRRKGSGRGISKDA